MESVDRPVMPTTELRSARVGGLTFNLEIISGESFEPNQTTDAIYSAVEIEAGDEVIEVGAGIGPGTIYLAAAKPLRKLHAIEIVPEQCELLRRNHERSGFGKCISIYQGSIFEPLTASPQPIRADVIVSDISGMNDIGYDLKWYPRNIPTGGPDGTDKIIPLLEQAPRYLNPNNPRARVYFPIAVNFSDKEKILAAAHRHFASVEYLEAATRKIPLKREQLDIITRSEHRVFTPIEPRGSRGFWTLEVYRATQPRS